MYRVRKIAPKSTVDSHRRKKILRMTWYTCFSLSSLKNTTIIGRRFTSGGRMIPVSPSAHNSGTRHRSFSGNEAASHSGRLAAVEAGEQRFACLRNTQQRIPDGERSGAPRSVRRGCCCRSKRSRGHSHSCLNTWRLLTESSNRCGTPIVQSSRYVPCFIAHIILKGRYP